MRIQIGSFLILVGQERDRVRRDNARVQNEKDHYPIPTDRRMKAT